MFLLPLNGVTTGFFASSASSCSSPLAFSSQESLSLPDFLQPWSGAWYWPARRWRIRRQRVRLRHRSGRDCQRPRLPLQRRRRGTDRHLLTRTAARDSMAGDWYATGGIGADACGEDMQLEQTHTLLRLL